MIFKAGGAMRPVNETTTAQINKAAMGSPPHSQSGESACMDERLGPQACERLADASPGSEAFRLRRTSFLSRPTNPISTARNYVHVRQVTDNRITYGNNGSSKDDPHGSPHCAVCTRSSRSSDADQLASFSLIGTRGMLTPSLPALCNPFHRSYDCGWC